MRKAHWSYVNLNPTDDQDSHTGRKRFWTLLNITKQSLSELSPSVIKVQM